MERRSDIGSTTSIPMLIYITYDTHIIMSTSHALVMSQICSKLTKSLIVDEHTIEHGIPILLFSSTTLIQSLEFCHCCYGGL